MNKFSLAAVSAVAAFAAACAWFLWTASAVSPASGAIAADNPAYASGALDSFAQCLADKGATMYGTTWCSHCQNQKALFGAAFKSVRYVECSVAGNPNAQSSACAAAGIAGYPTWTFKDGTRAEGELPFAILAYKTSCPEPVKIAAAVNLTGSAAQR